MKKLSLFSTLSIVSLLFLSISFVKAQQPHFNAIIGEIQNDIPVFTVDTNILKTSWSSFISNNSSLNLSFDKIFFRNIDNEFSILAIDFSNAATSKIDLVIDGNKIYEGKVGPETTDAYGGTYTVTCSGCEATGPASAGSCVPMSSYCTSCSKGSCVKTVTSSSSIIVTDVFYSQN